MPLICSPIQNQALQFAVESYDHLSHIELADSMKFSQNLGMDVDLLIGSDFYWKFLTGEIRWGEVGPVAMKTKVGWVLSGPVCQESTSQAASTNFVTSHVMHLETSSLECSSSKLKDPLVQQLQRFWEIESIGVSLDEGSVHDKFLDTIKQRDGRYEVCLPWRVQHPLLPDNFDLAMSCLMTLLPKLQKHPELLAEYDKIISEQTSKGIVSDVDLDEPVEVGHTHYLPHHAVLRDDKKTTKCRIVYDASSKTVGPMLNNCLYSGPSLVSDICDVLIRFRYHRIAIVKRLF